MSGKYPIPFVWDNGISCPNEISPTQSPMTAMMVANTTAPIVTFMGEQEGTGQAPFILPLQGAKICNTHTCNADLGTVAGFSAL